MVLDCAAYNVANILVDLLDVLPGLYILSTVGSIIFLQVNKGIEIANAKADLYSSMTISDMDVSYLSQRISCRSEAASRRIWSRPTRTSFLTPSNLFDRFRTTCCKFSRLLVLNDGIEMQ